MTEWMQHVAWVFSGAGVMAVVGAVNLLKKAQKPTGFGDDIQDIGDELIGKWKGTATEFGSDGRPGTEYSVTWRFYRRGPLLRCKSSTRYTQDGMEREDDYDLTARIVQNRFVLVEFFNSDGGLNFGSELLKVAENNQSFEGRFVSYSPDRTVILSGTIRGTRG